MSRDAVPRVGISGEGISFSILGPLEGALDGRPLDLGPPKQRAVLAALLVHANRVVSLDRFAELLWPEAAPPRSTASVPVHIANLRRLLEPGRPAHDPPRRLLTRSPGYLLRVAESEYDAATFETLAADGNRHLGDGRPRAARLALGEALGLWRGRALEEFAFAEFEASRLEQLRVSATVDRIQADLDLGAHTAVTVELEGLVAEHGLRERLVGLLMLALYRSGRQGEALRAYARARDHLREELGIEPGPDLRRLEGAILAQSPALDWRPPTPEDVPAPVRTATEPPPQLSTDPLVGRKVELAAVETAVARLGEAEGGIVLVSGEPGIGKTRLAQEAVERAAARGGAVAWGVCYEGEGAPPFWPWIQIVRTLLVHEDAANVRAALSPDAAEIAQVVPEVSTLMGELDPPRAADPAAARFRFFEAVAGFLERLSRRLPLTIVLDDLHWADPPSLELATHLAARVPGMDALLVITYRDVDPGPDERLTGVLARIARQPGRVDLALRGLSEPEVAQFIAHEAGAEPAAGVVAAVWARAAGNPFFVGELTRLLVAEGGLSETGLSETGARSAAVPWAVRQVIVRRLIRLPEPTRQLLAVAAIAGQEFDLAVVSIAAGLGLDAALDIVDVAVAAGLTTEQPGRPGCFRFSHVLVQETVYGETTGLRRARLHGRLADALEQAVGVDAAATEVAHHLHEAVAVVGARRAIAAAIRASSAAQAALAYEAAEDHLRRALGLLDAEPAGRDRDRQELDLQDRLAALLTLVKGVAVAETAAAWARATELCREVEDRRRLLPSLWGSLSYAWASGDAPGARALGDHILQLGRASAEPVVSAAAHLGLGSVALCCGDLVDGTRHLGAGKELADGVADHALADVTYADLRVQVDSWLAMALHLQGLHDEARVLVDGAVSRARGLGDPFTVAIALAFGVFARTLGGPAGEARQLADELLEHSDRYRMVDFAYHARVVRVWTLSQDPDTGGGPDATALMEGLSPAQVAGIRPWRPYWLALQAEVWQRAGRLAEAQRCVDDGLAEVAAIGSSFCTAELHRLRAELVAESAPERHAEALVDVREAVRIAGAQGAVLYRERAEASSKCMAVAGTGHAHDRRESGARTRARPRSRRPNH
ncbi:MAG: AAA family ATPase [Actinomycetota bacterium]|nr:AAA family ATPase [Actinomycetota bacterium]